MLFHAYHCTETKALFEDERFAQLNYEQVIKQYIKKQQKSTPLTIEFPVAFHIKSSTNNILKMTYLFRVWPY
jgi:hypothetical protein